MVSFFQNSVEGADTFFGTSIVFTLEFTVILCKVKGSENRDFQRIGVLAPAAISRIRVSTSSASFRTSVSSTRVFKTREYFWS